MSEVQRHGEAGTVGASPQGCRVLVVDDEPALRALATLVLERAGHRVVTAPDGSAALEAVRVAAPDVIVLDVMMPGMTGWQVLDALAASPDHADLPVVMLTALAEEQDQIRSHLSGAVQHVVKPLCATTLLRAVEAAVVPPSEVARAARRQRIRHALTRLAVLDAGREVGDPIVRFSGLEPPPRSPRAWGDPAELTDRQRQVAELLAAGSPARRIAEQLGMSRTAVYATRTRIARVLAVAPQDVAVAARELGLGPAAVPAVE